MTRALLLLAAEAPEDSAETPAKAAQAAPSPSVYRLQPWTNGLLLRAAAPWLIVAVVGTSVAVERVLAGQHFPTDVLVGAAVGVTTGVLVP